MVIVVDECLSIIYLVALGEQQRVAAGGSPSVALTATRNFYGTERARSSQRCLRSP